MPEFSYAGVYQYEGIVFPDNDIMRENGNQILAISYGVANPDNPERTIDITIDIPLISEAEPAAEPLAVFHFELNDYRVTIGQGLRYEFRQINSVSYDNYEVQMRSVRALPETTETLFCYGTPAGSYAPLPLRSAVLEVPAFSGNEFNFTDIAFLPDASGLMDQCALLRFPCGNPEGDESLHLTVRS